jgi:micrococcal nuclease
VLRRALPWLLAAGLGGVLVVPRLLSRGGGVTSGPARVVRVVDGDTVVARLAGGDVEKVRYLGIDTPEDVKPNTPVQCFSLTAARENRRLVQGREVVLRLDREHRDRYGRLLAYVYRRADRAFVNARLVAGGYARDLPFAPNTTHAALFRRLRVRAARRGLGLWSRC